MTEEIKDICALCKHFKMREYPEHAREGLGRCMGYDNDPFTKLSNPFISWGKKACARFRQDYAGTEVRTAWVEKQRAKAQGNNAAQPETKELDGKRHQTASNITKRS